MTKNTVPSLPLVGLFHCLNVSPTPVLSFSGMHFHHNITRTIIHHTPWISLLLIQLCFCFCLSTADGDLRVETFRIFTVSYCATRKLINCYSKKYVDTLLYKNSCKLWHWAVWFNSGTHKDNLILSVDYTECVYVCAFESYIVQITGS